MAASESESDPQGLRKLQKELNSGAIAIVLLATLRHAARPMYGYEIAKQLVTVAGLLPMNAGALYPVLRSLESAELLTSHVEPATTGPPRRYYQITDAGVSAFAAWRDVWQRTKQFVDASLEPPNENKSNHGKSRTRGRNGHHQVHGGTRKSD